MAGPLRPMLCVIGLLHLPVATATTVIRCEDALGHITYTLQGCPIDQIEDRQDASNPTPGSAKPVPLAKPQGKSRSHSTLRFVTTGEQQDGCGNQVTGRERREAMIKQQVRAGMTQADIESALGKPDKITRQNGQTRYHYRSNEGHSRQVSFDENGCVRGKR